jgi:hypothetical protein
MQLIKNIIKYKDRMFILFHTIVDCLLSMANYYGSHKKMHSKIGKQLLSFYQKVLSNSDRPKILTQDNKKIFLKTFGKVST